MFGLRVFEEEFEVAFFAGVWPEAGADPLPLVGDLGVGVHGAVHVFLDGWIGDDLGAAGFEVVVGFFEGEADVAAAEVEDAEGAEREGFEAVFYGHDLKFSFFGSREKHQQEAGSGGGEGDCAEDFFGLGRGAGIGEAEFAA